MADANLKVTLTADDQMSPVLRDITGQLNEIQNEYGALLQTKWEWRPWALSITGWIVAALILALS